MNGGGELILDVRQFNRLAVELESRSCAEGFVGRFLDRLPDRIASIHQSLLEGKSERALVAILSVATSAAMAGAIRLEGHSRAVERSLRAGDLEAAKTAAGALDTNAAAFGHHVSGLLGSSQPSLL